MNMVFQRATLGTPLHALVRAYRSDAQPLLTFAIILGVAPQSLFHYMQPSVDRTVTELADWSRTNEPAKLKSNAAVAMTNDQAPMTNDSCLVGH